MPQFHLTEHILTNFFFFFFNDTATTEIYTLSLHDALPIYGRAEIDQALAIKNTIPNASAVLFRRAVLARDRKSTRLNSSHQIISYAVFCLKKKNSKKGLFCKKPYIVEL